MWIGVQIANNMVQVEITVTIYLTKIKRVRSYGDIHALTPTGNADVHQHNK